MFDRQGGASLEDFKRKFTESAKSASNQCKNILKKYRTDGYPGNDDTSYL